MGGTAPLLYIGGFNTSWRDFNHNIVSILMLAFGLVGFTVFGIAVAMDIATALLALFVLKQMRATYLGDRLSSSSAEFAPVAPRSRASLPLGGR